MLAVVVLVVGDGLHLDVAVATPKLRLAPEHVFPAAYDDLKAAHAYLVQYGVDPHRASPPPTRMALFAESSGGALALAMLVAGRFASSSTRNGCRAVRSGRIAWCRVCATRLSSCRSYRTVP